MKLFKKSDLILFPAFVIFFLSLRSYYGSEDRSFEKLQPISRSMDIPETVPYPSNESIKGAIEIFNIKVPSYTSYEYSNDNDPTTRGTANYDGRNCYVHINNIAFEDWQILGSTLAHEIEIHCRQSPTVVALTRMLLLDAESIYERSAYQYELDNRERFGLSDDQAGGIKAAMNYFYPVKK